MKIYCVLKNGKFVSRFYGSPYGVVGSLAESFCAEHPGANVEDVRGELIKELVASGSVSVVADDDEWEMKTYISEDDDDVL